MFIIPTLILKKTHLQKSKDLEDPYILFVQTLHKESNPIVTTKPKLLVALSELIKSQDNPYVSPDHRL